MDKTIQKICDVVVTQYKSNKNVLGILLFGSAARGKFDTYSDVDIYILLKKKEKLSRKNFVQDRVRVDIILDSLPESDKYLKEDKNNVRRNTSHMLAHGQILFQRGVAMKRIVARAQSNLKSKTKYTKGEILMRKYSIDDFWDDIQRDIENEDHVAFGLDSNLLISNIIELFLKINGEFFRQPNEMAALLRKHDKAFSEKIGKFYHAESLKEKGKILSDLIDYMYKKSGGPLPREWSL